MLCGSEQNVFAMCSPFVSYNLILNDCAVASPPAMVVSEKAKKMDYKKNKLFVFFLLDVFNQR